MNKEKRNSHRAGKRACALALALLLAAALLTGCTTTEGQTPTDTASTVSMRASLDVPSDPAEQVTALPPWEEADGAQDAAEKAGLSGFEMATGYDLSVGFVQPASYRWISGLAEIYIPLGGAELYVRKGIITGNNEDISGVSKAYAHTWHVTCKGMDVTCYGDEEGKAAKVLWRVDREAYSMYAAMAGGEGTFGLIEDDLRLLIEGIE